MQPEAGSLRYSIRSLGADHWLQGTATGVRRLSAYPQARNSNTSHSRPPSTLHQAWPSRTSPLPVPLRLWSPLAPIRRGKERKKLGFMAGGERRGAEQRRFHLMAVAQTWEKGEKKERKLGDKCGEAGPWERRGRCKTCAVVSSSPVYSRRGSRLACCWTLFCGISDSCTGVDKTRTRNLVLCFLCWLAFSSYNALH